jgi:hypothetical protein
MFLCPRPLPPAFFLLLYVNGKYSEIGKKQVFARFPHFPALADMFTSRQQRSITANGG